MNNKRLAEKPSLAPAKKPAEALHTTVIFYGPSEDHDTIIIVAATDRLPQRFKRLLPAIMESGYPYCDEEESSEQGQDESSSSSSEHSKVPAEEFFVEYIEQLCEHSSRRRSEKIRKPNEIIDDVYLIPMRW